MATQALHRALNDELAPTGITYRQSQVIGWLAVDGELSMCDLAGRMLIEPPTLVGILERMEHNGWIERSRCDDDRRRKRICLTPAAEPVWERIVECICRVRERALSGLATEETDQLVQVLRRIHGNLVASLPVATAPGKRELE